MADIATTEQTRYWERFLPQARRPNPEQIAHLLRHLAQGGTTRDWLQAHPMVHPYAPSMWAQHDPEIAAAIESAKRAGNERSLEACLAIAADESLEIDRAKLMVATRMQVLGRIDPRFAERPATAAAVSAVAQIQIVTGVPPRAHAPQIVATNGNGAASHD